MKSLLIVLIGVFIFAPVSEAKKRKKKRKSMSYMAPWGMAGCGLGSLAMKKNEKVDQIVAAFLNNLISPQTSAITSGTSNCAGNNSSAAISESEAYVEANLNTLQKDVSKGSGVILQNFAEILGCNENQEMMEEFGNIGKLNFQDIFNTSNPSIIVKNYLGEIKNNEILAKSCLRVG